jgi:hypothetical protein
VVLPGASAPGTLKVTTDEKICGLSVADETVMADKSGGIAHAVVTAVGVAWSGPPAAPHVVNKGCRFIPHVSVARPGATLEVTSDDPTLHTTHLYAGDQSLFNIALPVPGIVIRRPLDRRPALLRLACDTHPWMRAYVLVAADRSVVTGTDGSFLIPDVPSGRRRIIVWHESLQAPAQDVAVTAGQTVELTITLTRR